MEYEKIKQLMNDMENSKLTELSIELPDGAKISMKKEVRNVVQNNQISNNLEENIVQKKETNNIAKTEEQGNIVKSPMVGTFYIKPSPTELPYVQIGKMVKKGDTLCIIEAMKLMNEIESEYNGEIVEILVKDGDIVEYGTPLFRIV